MTQVPVRPEMLRWAYERAGMEPHDIATRFPRMPDWERGDKRPTLRQLEAFAKATHTPFGYLFLPEPPEERLPIPDLRTNRRRATRPSPDLLDTIYSMQRRQDFLRELRIEDDRDLPGFVGSARLRDEPEAIGREIRRTAGLGEGWASQVPTWEAAVGELRRRIEQLGVMAVVNGVVGNNTHRALDVDEFRGFALTDSHAPLIFVNGADAKSAQMFTLAHELAHIWLGPEGEGLSGFDGIFPGDERVETFCDQVAAEFLVPTGELRQWWPRFRRASDPFGQIARSFKVSPIVAGRRAMDLGLVDREAFFSFYDAYARQHPGRPRPSRGGDFYNTQNARVGESFGRAVLFAAMEGRITFKEAYDLTGLRGGTFQTYARRLGVFLP